METCSDESAMNFRWIGDQSDENGTYCGNCGILIWLNTLPRPCG
jgi:hypothetical protein